MDQEEFDAKFSRKPAEDEKLLKCGELKKRLRPRSILHSILSFLPIVQWLPKYRWKEDLHGDIIGGLTVGIMHVPQGMAYASLASLPPVYGMYSSFFTSTIYMFFGTSRHVSIGVFAVASMMVGIVRLRLVPDPEVIDDGNGTTTVIPVKGPIDFGYDLTPLQLTSALAFAVGVAQLIMGALRLGFLTTYMSDTLVSGFTTGAACHVFTAQLNKVIGVKLPRYDGPGMLFFMIRDLILSLPQTNYVSLVMSLFALTFLAVGKDYINPWVKKRSPVPVPLELILVIIATVFSVVMDLKKNCHVKIVDYIPQGVPEPSLPKLDVCRHIISDAIGIAIVSYMFVISLAKLFAKKRKYKIDPGQELYAVGFMSLFSSFFPVYPAGASLSRSSVCEQSGANTQLYTVFSSVLLFVVIQWLGPLLEPLPMCILACIVIISLRSLFLQCLELPRLWKISKFDFMVWIVCCVATLSNDVMTGLIVSVIFTLISVVLREQWPKIYLLGSATESIYKPKDRYAEVTVNGNIKILRFEAPLHFANVSSFVEKVDDLICSENTLKDVSIVDPKKKDPENGEDATGAEYKELSQEATSDEHCMKKSSNDSSTASRTIIVDCGAISNIDSMGVEALKEVYMDGTKQNVEIYYANLSESILDILERIEFYKSVPRTSFYPDVQQAVQAATSA